MWVLHTAPWAIRFSRRPRHDVREAGELHFEDGPVRPRNVQLHYVKDELLTVEAA